jgi:hypothetical protein
MNLNECIHDFNLYVRAIESGFALILMIGILGIRSLITDEPFFSL